MEARRSQSSLNGRRRRLLVNVDSSDLMAEFQALAPQTTPTAAPRITVSAPDRQILYRIVSGQLWKHGLLILAVALLGVTAVLIENDQPQALQRMAATSRPRISQGLTGAFLVVAGQLSLMIGWIRSRSSVDFSGRYRCWKWLAGCLIMLGGLWITNLQDSLPHLAQMFAEPLIGVVGAARRTLVVVPAAALSIWILSRALPDMARNRWAQCLFALGILAAVGRLLLSYSTIPGSYPPPVLNGILLSAAGLLVCSLLLHTRFVLYICKDPPDQSTVGTKKVKQSDRRKSETPESQAPIAEEKLTTAKTAGEAGLRLRRRADDDKSPDLVATDCGASDSESASESQSSGRKNRKQRRTRKAA